ncbi:LTA synthase family protein [Hathewaya histolytica]|nr:LTA synthase family protein [Hathewaya histolytica]
MFNLAPIGYHIHDGYTYYKDSKKYELSTKEIDEINNWMKLKAELLPDNKYKSLFKGKNLIIIQVESLENFIINKKIDNSEITPNLNKLLKNSIYFKNIKEQTFNGTTSDGELLTNTSIFPVRRGSTFFRYPNNTYRSSLPELLEGLGYNTLAIHPDRGSYWNWLPSLSSIGFNKCIDSSYFNLDEKIGLGLSDGSFLKQLVPILKKQKEPFYNFSITLTSHAPFNIPEKYKTIVLPPNIKYSALGRYFQSINYTDKAIGYFVSNLDKSGILDNSVLVFYGDHEGPHRFFKDQIASMKDIPEWMRDNNSKVPLIIYSKGYKSEVIETHGGQVDILPTLSYLMGVDTKNYVYTSMGRNILNTKRNFVILPNGNIESTNLSKNEVEIFSKATKYSNKIIESNYFRKEH